jgi:hypothetical protein
MLQENLVEEGTEEANAEVGLYPCFSWSVEF